MTSVVTETKYLAPAGYQARHDPDFPDVIAGQLMRHVGEWVRFTGYDSWAVRDVVQMLRRFGVNVLGSRQRGYSIPYEAPFRRARYVHLRAAAAWPPEDAPPDQPGQLTMLDDEAVD